MSEKGGVSVYGLGRFPVTLYKEQWSKLLDMAEDIRTFIKENEVGGENERVGWATNPQSLIPNPCCYRTVSTTSFDGAPLFMPAVARIRM